MFAEFGIFFVCNTYWCGPVDLGYMVYVNNYG